MGAAAVAAVSERRARGAFSGATEWGSVKFIPYLCYGIEIALKLASPIPIAPKRTVEASEIRAWQHTAHPLGSVQTEQRENLPSMSPGSFKFHCAACGQHISVTLADVGTRGQCPACGVALVVPPPPSAEPAQLATPRKLWRVLLVGGLGIVGLIVVAAGGIYLHRLRSPTPTVIAPSIPAATATPASPSAPLPPMSPAQALVPTPSPAAAVAAKPAAAAVQAAPQPEPARAAPLAEPAAQAPSPAARHKYSLMSPAEAEKLARDKISKGETPPDMPGQTTNWGNLINEAKIASSGVKLDEDGFIVLAKLTPAQLVSRVWPGRGNLDAAWPAMKLPEVENAHRRLGKRLAMAFGPNKDASIEGKMAVPDPGFLLTGLLWLSDAVELADCKTLAVKGPTIQWTEIRPPFVNRNTIGDVKGQNHWEEVKPVIPKGVHLWSVGPLGVLIDQGGVILVAVRKPIANIPFENDVMPEVSFTILNQARNGIRVEFGGTGFEMAMADLPFLDSPAPGKSYRVSAGMNMVWVAPGSFQMGDAMSGGSADEQPVHEVRFTSGYWLGETAVTQGQWQAVMGNNPSYFKGDNLPVQIVSWNEATEFCKKLTGRARAAGRLPAGMEYRLPTEAQWEYACRAGTKGDDAGNLDAVAWYSANSGKRTHEVKTKSPNAWGLYDMHGNVWQWCADWYGNYPAGMQVNPTGPGSGAERVLRGGCWTSAGSDCRSAVRKHDNPARVPQWPGFRLAAVPSSGL